MLARDGDGKIVAALTGRITAELMLTVDQKAVAPFKMLAAIYKLWTGVRGWLWSVGIADVHAPIGDHTPTFYEFAKTIGFKDSTRLHLTYDIRKHFSNE